MSTPSDTLGELHGLHQRAKAIREQLESGPKAIHARRIALNVKKTALEAARKGLQDERLLQQKRESQLKSQQTKAADLRVKLNVIKKTDEYNMIMRQIQTETASARQTEELILDSMQKTETQTAALAVLEAEFQTAAQDLETFVSQVEAQNISRKTQLVELEAAIIGAEAAIPADSRDQYIRVVKQRGADSLASVEDSVCNGCFVQVTTQCMNELINGQKMTFCKVCGRLLYLADDQRNVLKRKGKG